MDASAPRTYPFSSLSTLASPTLSPSLSSPQTSVPPSTVHARNHRHNTQRDHNYEMECTPASPMNENNAAHSAYMEEGGDGKTRPPSSTGLRWGNVSCLSLHQDPQHRNQDQHQVQLHQRHQQQQQQQRMQQQQDHDHNHDDDHEHQFQQPQQENRLPLTSDYSDPSRRHSFANENVNDNESKHAFHPRIRAQMLGTYTCVTMCSTCSICLHVCACMRVWNNPPFI